MVGLYAVTAHAVTQRAREIGVRMALGASRPQILALVFGQGGRLIATGLALGVAGAVASTHVAGRLLFEISPTDPETFALTGMLLGALALLACYVPARRAAGVNPVAALRGE